MYFLDKRIQMICDELKKLYQVQNLEMDGWQYKDGYYVTPEEAAQNGGEFQTFDSKTMHWYGPDNHVWFQTKFEVPESFDGKDLWLKLRTKRQGFDDPSNPQFLLFINGEPIQGVDYARTFVHAKNEVKAGEILEIAYQAHSGGPAVELGFFVNAVEVDPEIWGLYYDLQVPLQAFIRWDKENPSRYRLEHAMNEAVNLLDLRNPYSEEFYASVQAAREYLAVNLYEKLAGEDEVIASCIGHSHIDVAWWWTVEQTREKVSRTFATVLKLMDEYPEYKFMASQPQLYEFLKERYPSLYESVKQRVKEGRWEPEGGMWVEPDCNLTSGESLVRQFLFGKRFFKEEFGVDNKVLWLPDVFGYSAAMPQIMKKSGIDYFMTTKLSWNQFNKVPMDTFFWKGIDGSKVFTHFISTMGSNQKEDDFNTTYNGDTHPSSLIGGWRRYQEKQINNDILIAYGHGDGGGGPTREMLETSKRLEKGITGIPKTRQVFSKTYFDELIERVGDNKRLKTWDGELYFEYHRGTYTSMARNKKSNRFSEIGMMDIELLQILAAEQVAYDFEKVNSMWKTILLNQFHDILPGSSIEEVYEVTKAEYEEIAAGIDEIKEKTTASLVSGNEHITVFNTTGFSGGNLIEVENTGKHSITDKDGKGYPLQSVGETQIAYVDGLPSKGYEVFTLSEEVISREPFQVSNDHHIETPFYSVSFDEHGCIRSIFDKENEREVLQVGKAGNLFKMYEDKPMNYDNWDIEIYHTEKSWDVLSLESFAWEEIGEVRASLRVERKISNSTLVQKIHFYADSRRIDFETEVDWKEHQHLLKVEFPVDVHTSEGTFEIQFGNVKRKLHANTLWDEARFESCAQKWMDLSEGNYGVSLLNNCKYGHSVKDSCMALTLIKSGIVPNPNTDYEMHYFTYSLYPHAGTWVEAGTVEAAYQLNQGTYTRLGAATENYFSLASVNNKNVVIETIKRAEDNSGTIVRMYECENARTKATLTWNKGFENVFECNLMEELIEEISTVAGNEISFTIQPYEIKTLLIKD